MRIFIICAIGAPLGYLLATPLLAWADHLLARVTQADAAPLALEIVSQNNLQNSPSPSRMGSRVPVPRREGAGVGQLPGKSREIAI